MKNIYQIILDSAAKWPDQPALFDEWGSLTYKEFAKSTEQLKTTLISAGLKPGMGLGLMARNSRQFLMGLFAGVGCNATVLPISHQLKAAEIAGIISETKLHLVLDDFSGTAPESDDSTALEGFHVPLRLSWTEFRNEESIASHVEHPAFIRFTSGTTGKAKGVIISHQSVWERTASANKALKLGPSDRVVWVLPMAYHFVVSMVLYMRYGVPMIICKDFLAQSILKYTQDFKGTFLYASPMHIRMLANDASGQALPSLKTVISTSTGITSAICEAFTKKYAIPVSQAYGIIEVGLPIINFERAKTDPAAVGHALPDYEVEILDDDNQVLSVGEIGHLAMRGPGMFDAYLTPPTPRSEVLEGGWFMTGDLASKSSDDLIKIEGRKKSMINVSGNKVFPEEVEAVLITHPDIKACRVSGTTHRFMGEIVQAEIVLKSSEQPEIEALISYCRKRLSTYKVPQRISFVEELPLTGSGKIIRGSSG